MEGQSVRHSLIVSRTLVMLSRAVPDNLEVATGPAIVANGRNRTPDIIVFDVPYDQGAPVVPAPVLVVEVVSPSTRVIDRFDKNVDYAKTPSVQHYLMLSEERQSAVLCSRVNDGWISQESEGSCIVELRAIGVELALDEVYRRVAFPAGAA